MYTKQDQSKVNEASDLASTEAWSTESLEDKSYSPDDFENNEMAHPFSFYDDVDAMFAASYFAQDAACFNHWEESAGIGQQLPYEPDFFKYLPRTLSEVQQWLSRNLDTK
mmetsp:Transcript_32142/g.48879  ORF Transcript_32142/g.48879 Transcript_32142/m.48879 type:complete len:110 (-) Transcript_32142:594-923(-)